MGDCSALADWVEGQVFEIKWRAIRVRTAADALIVVQNSIIANAVMANHGRILVILVFTIRISGDHEVSPQG